MKLDLTLNGAPVTTEVPPTATLLEVLREDGYTIDRAEALTRNAWMDQDLINLHKRPCGGVVVYSVFRNADLQRTHVETMRPEGMLVETDNRVVSVFLTSVGASSSNTKNCSNPVMALLTKPKKR